VSPGEGALAVPPGAPRCGRPASREGGVRAGRAPRDWRDVGAGPIEPTAPPPAEASPRGSRGAKISRRDCFAPLVPRRAGVPQLERAPALRGRLAGRPGSAGRAGSPAERPLAARHRPTGVHTKPIAAGSGPAIRPNTPGTAGGRVRATLAHRLAHRPAQGGRPNDHAGVGSGRVVRRSRPLSSSAEPQVTEEEAWPSRSERRLASAGTRGGRRTPSGRRASAAARGASSPCCPTRSAATAATTAARSTSTSATRSRKSAVRRRSQRCAASALSRPPASA
jgi:hypothetical protein